VVVISRFCTGPMGTFGRLFAGPAQFYTVERPWLDNKPFESCVPAGDYQLRWLPTTTPVPEEFGGCTWYLEGGSVGIDSGERTRIALHVANVSSDVAGCIGVGTRLGTVNGKWAVNGSVDALRQLKLILPKDGSITLRYAFDASDL